MNASIHFYLRSRFIELDMVQACDRVGSGPDSSIGWLSPGVIEKSMYRPLGSSS